MDSRTLPRRRSEGRLPVRPAACRGTFLSPLLLGLFIAVPLAGFARPAAAEPLAEIGSSFDDAGRALNNQLGEWFGDKPHKTTRPARRQAMPARAPLPPPRPAQVGEAASNEEGAKPAEKATPPASESATARTTPKDTAPVTAKPVDRAKAQAAPAEPAQEKQARNKPAQEPSAQGAPAPAPPVTAAATSPPPKATPVKPAKPARVATAPLPPPSPERRMAAAPAPPPAEPAPGTADPQHDASAALDEEPVEAPMPLATPEATAKPSATPSARSSVKLAASAPLPPARPAEVPPAADGARVAALTPDSAPQAEGAAPKTPAIPTVCPELSNGDLGEFTPVTVTATNPLCTVDRAVSLSAVRMKDGRLVKLEPAATLRCEMAASVAHWLREQVDPAVATLGAPLDTVLVAASQQCRPRNRVAGAKISEHGRGNAMDTRGYQLSDGRVFVIGPGKGKEETMPQAFQEILKASACTDFTTILGPGSDGYHEHHLHVDRAERRSGMVICHWAIGSSK
ncbi:extensin family protein [Ancylobacter sp. MQZ15Z-1]|uniref:Extensin family protein n=1 Tax=Ancylobacter mangrovi TaxID=2972472 RepID=A0A9X2PDE2_9HYPH|nr:extensin family protein [Ancylobacter mangrovi]MCS0494836.1 extensin family protein [Ancylobacter mangrovi]